MTKTVGAVTLALWGAWMVCGVRGASIPTQVSPPSTQPAKQLTLDLGKKATMQLAWIPAGKFTMGSPADEKVRRDDELPPRVVTLTAGFYMGVYDVTQEQYEAVMGANPSHFKDANHPVETVSWADAVKFCKELSQKTGKTVRLPTEAQWEYACRAGTTTCFSFGNDVNELGKYAWYSENSDRTTHPVGRKLPNAWGLYDMQGNVWQWCSDWYADSYANMAEKDPAGPPSGTARVLRGGSWIGSPLNCRPAYRGKFDPDGRRYSIGFRVVLDLK